MIDPIHPNYINTPTSSQRPAYDYRPVDLSSAPCVSIVTPFYNTGPVFHETARCILQQSLQQWEWLIINDGSTRAESLALLDAYRNRDVRIRVIDHECNRGLSAARNTGFQAAQTAYVVQLDSDDLLEPTAVEKWAWFLESYPEYAFTKGYTVGFGAQEYLWRKGFHDGRAFLEENIVAATSLVRTVVHSTVGGFDETFRGGLEDWDFWLRCASHGYWGGSIPEYLDWYRRREAHEDRWTDWNKPHAVQRRLRKRYPQLWAEAFPQIQPRWHAPYDQVPDRLPWENRLHKEKPRLLMMLPWLTLGGADKFNLDVLEQLTRCGWEVSLVTTLTGDSSWLPKFAAFTPDVFILHHFLRLTDYPRFLRYLIQSRQIDQVMISNSEFGYLLLPYLRATCPGVSFVDYCHMEEEYWKNGGYPRLAVEYQHLLDLNIVSSAHLRRWMVSHGAQQERIQVCYTNIDAQKWQPLSAERRRTIRQKFSVNDDIPILLYAGRICEQKQPRVFAQTLTELQHRTTDWMALVAGDGPDLEWLRSFIKRHGLAKHVQLLGAVSNDIVRELMGAVDIFFLPSQWEGIALSLYEAMANGLAIVGADVGGQRELVTPECGILIPRGTIEDEVAAYTAALANLVQDAGRRQRVGEAARQRVCTEFRLEQLTERLGQLFQEAQHNHAVHPCSLPSLGLARSCAMQAVEYTRLTVVAEELWQEREKGKRGALAVPSVLSPPPQLSWRMALYFALRRFLLPYYRRALNRDMRWCLVLKDSVKRLLLRHG